MDRKTAIDRLTADLEYRRWTLARDEEFAAKKAGRSKAKQQSMAYQMAERRADIDALTMALAALAGEG